MCSEKRSAGPAFLSALCSMPPSPDELDATQVLGRKPDKIESVQTGVGLAVATEQPVEVRQAVKTVSGMSDRDKARALSRLLAAGPATNFRALWEKTAP